ncbi:uncharacterized protein F4822DRAFT_426553 [Hypoxylon trugodes]|uniref:uncharacterized protein n=1 Tax=Hypoxylon trugodes TaxID=326681 RepID=UPI00218F7394|nr:uncharacterized protein F4822DRAFT_426553 [Hypoxylon trugodes]KAI1390705.1 hypothetical protein F4822DRAFT_426553 [Hypoxylon trugodes]
MPPKGNPFGALMDVEDDDNSDEGQNDGPELRRLPSPEITLPHRPLIVNPISLGNRFYARETVGRDKKATTGLEGDRIDALIYIKDITRNAASNDDLTQRIKTQLTGLQEYSREYDYVVKKHKRIQVNNEGLRLLYDMDELIQTVKSLDAYARDRDMTNSVMNYFNNLLGAQGFDMSSYRNTGIYEDFMEQVYLGYLGRIRFMKDYIFQDSSYNPQDNDPIWPFAEPQLSLLVRHFNTRVHGPNFRSDLRCVEWFSGWYQVLGDTMRKTERPDRFVDGDDERNMQWLYYRTYGVEVKDAEILVSSTDFEYDVEIIESWIAWKHMTETLHPRHQNPTLLLVHRDFYLPWIAQLVSSISMLQPGSGKAGMADQSIYNEAVRKRHALIDYVDTYCEKIWANIGRRNTAAVPRERGVSQAKENQLAYETNGWLCSDHRKPITLYECEYPGCTKKSAYPDQQGPKYYYEINEQSLPNGYVSNGTAIYPVRVQYQWHTEPLDSDHNLTRDAPGKVPNQADIARIIPRGPAERFNTHPAARTDVQYDPTDPRGMHSRLFFVNHADYNREDNTTTPFFRAPNPPGGGGGGGGGAAKAQAYYSEDSSSSSEGGWRRAATLLQEDIARKQTGISRPLSTPKRGRFSPYETLSAPNEARKKRRWR